MTTTKHVSRVWLYALAATMLAIMLTGWGLMGNPSGSSQNGSVPEAHAQSMSEMGPQGPNVEDTPTWTPTWTPTSTNTNTPTNTPTPIIYPTGEPELEILQYVVNNANLYCQGPFGTPGHRYVTNCYP